MKTVAIVQARMGSTRLPNKVMKSIAGVPMIELLIRRLSRAKKVDEIVLATSTEEANQPLIEHVQELGYRVYVGSEDDVLNRYRRAADFSDAETVIRITGDCPLVDPQLVDEVVDFFFASKADYVSNTEPPTFPDGLDIEVFSKAVLVHADEHAIELFDREHVTPFIRKNTEHIKHNFKNGEGLAHLRWTVDEPEDLELIRKIFEHFEGDAFSWKEVLAFQRENAEVFSVNQNIERNQGASMGKGQKLWQRAKRIIPGGNMLLSKRAEMFLPDHWPAYYSKAEGCTVWDMDGRALTDVSIMGIGTNILGYAHPEVNQAAMNAIASSNMSTLNCPEEVYLAEKLVEMHPWSDMVRFARTGGEANAVAIRIARAASGKDKVAICGYHGWHDWYLSANLGDDQNLAGHLLPGLSPNGVPKSLQGTVLPFQYNDYDGLVSLLEKHDVGVIKMEVVRNHGPEDNFLRKVRDLATQKGIILIFDECTSGFRQTFGGIHKLYGVEPDMAMFGKALGNGFAITATIGRREVMEAAQTSFISSTFWTERTGSAAALKTLEVMEREKSWEYITQTGQFIRAQWQSMADSHDLSITHWGIPALTGFTINAQNSLAYKTLITQEMLKKGYLAANSVYVSVVHTKEILELYFAALDEVFQTIKRCEEGKANIMDLLDGPICHAGFKRLN